MQFCLKIPKNVIYFCVRQLEMPKVAFQKCDVITFTCCFGHCRAKNKDIALKFCLHVVCMYFDHMYSGFLIPLKIWILYAIIFEKSKFWISGAKLKMSKFRESHIVARSVYVFWLLRIVFYFKRAHSRRLQTFAVFWSKIAEHDDTKTPFFPKSINGFSWNFIRRG